MTFFMPRDLGRELPRHLRHPTVLGLQLVGRGMVEFMHYYFGPGWGKSQELWFLTTDTSPVALGNGATNVAASSNVSKEADFIADRIGHHVRLNATPEDTTLRAITYDMIDGATDRTLTHPNPVHNFASAGTGQRPLIFTKAKMFPRTTSIRYRFNNLAVGAAVDVFWTLVGYREFELDELNITSRSR